MIGINDKSLTNIQVKVKKYVHVLVMLKPRYVELDEEEQQLFRAAFDTPSYDHDEYHEDENMQLGNLDLLKDALWAVKAKINELKAFNKALAANLLSTKLKVKELLAKHSHGKKHQHETPEKKKVIHNYQVNYNKIF